MRSHTAVTPEIGPLKGGERCSVFDANPGQHTLDRRRRTSERSSEQRSRPPSAAKGRGERNRDLRTPRAAVVIESNLTDRDRSSTGRDDERNPEAHPLFRIGQPRLQPRLVIGEFELSLLE